MSAANLTILAACAQVFVLVIASIRTIRGRFRDVRQNGVRVKDIVITTVGYTEPVQKLQANLSNQFETPIYFFAAILFGLQVGAVGTLFAVLAWIYVATRLMHHVIHTGWNHILYRMSVFVTGLVAVVLMWALVALQILTA
ncbi:MAPEG family protein [Rhodobacteraceae bacterium NNCM2]|nr:MAPEG family protein [Coraliihabitans acroporae]